MTGVLIAIVGIGGALVVVIFGWMTITIHRGEMTDGLNRLGTDVNGRIDSLRDELNGRINGLERRLEALERRRGPTERPPDR